MTRRRSDRGGTLSRLLAALLLLGACGAGVWLWADWSRFADAPLAVRAQGQTVEVARGMSLNGIVQALRAQQVSAAPAWYWRALAARMRVAGRLHAGEYALDPGLTPRALLERMAAGRVLQRRFTIVEGWTFRQMRDELHRADRLAIATADLDAAGIMRRLGFPGEAPEGRFLPETYAYVLGDSDLDLLQRAHEAMGKYLATQWAQRDPAVPLQTPYQALVLASIVEKETGRGEERAEIAGVFERRLKLGMRLQTDPTVIYGLGSAYDGNLRKRDLEADTPFNTYTRAGLPPTPIALPGKAAIAAVLHPAPGDALYFVARGDGTHQFSATIEEHNRAVARYQLGRKK
ncbi:MAG: endolytic transglycosylase MltG [Mizugakiibacter sp.]|uniref:endolytic transglycosylase MltG n=1 Tax=Mizugakiibacter sp. TaxID=1972610 RepID=UPI0031BC0E6B|nr:endolytic transglycosylase MltG [Xanthomonadaceae bacterium]